MALLAATDVTYTLDQNDASYPLGKNGKQLFATLAFGDSSKELPVGGLPLVKEKLGCAYRILTLEVISSNKSGYFFEYDVANEKLQILQATGDAGAAKSLEASPTSLVAPPAMTLKVRVIGY